MLGPKILVRSLSKATLTDSNGRAWQYLSRSDRHSKVACWGILFDLMLESALVREHAEKETVAFGINHEMTDFKLNRKKDLDLVVCTPRIDDEKRDVRKKGFVELVDHYQIELTEAETKKLRDLPPIIQAPVGTVRIALEAKACMTEHAKACPRLFDELTSSHATIHGASAHALAVGYVVVNHATTFASPGRNRDELRKKHLVLNEHKQPHAAQKVFEKIGRLNRRTKADEEGFDAFAFTSIDCKNDGSEVTLVTKPPALPTSDSLHYEQMIRRLAAEYALRYPR